MVLEIRTLHKLNRIPERVVIRPIALRKRAHELGLGKEVYWRLVDLRVVRSLLYITQISAGARKDTNSCYDGWRKTYKMPLVFPTVF